MKKITDRVMLGFFAVRVGAIMMWCMIKSTVLILFMVFKEGGLDMSKVVMRCTFEDAQSVDVMLYHA